MKNNFNSDKSSTENGMVSQTEKMMLMNDHFQDENYNESTSDLDINSYIIDEIKNKLDQVYLAHKSRTYLVKEISYYILNKK